MATIKTLESQIRVNEKFDLNEHVEEEIKETPDDEWELTGEACSTEDPDCEACQ